MITYIYIYIYIIRGGPGAGEADSIVARFFRTSFPEMCHECGVSPEDAGSREVVIEAVVRLSRRKLEEGSTARWMGPLDAGSAACRTRFLRSFIVFLTLCLADAAPGAIENDPSLSLNDLFQMYANRKMKTLQVSWHLYREDFLFQARWEVVFTGGGGEMY